MTVPDLKPIARELAQECNSLEVATIEKALEKGYLLCLAEVESDFRKMLQDLVVSRMKNTAPQ